MNRQPFHRLAMLSAVCLWLASSSPVLSQGGDRVVGPRGVPIEGIITQITRNYVKIQSKGVEQTISVDQIRKVSFADDPAELERARQAALEGRYQSALDELNKIDMNRVKQDTIRQDIMFYRALAASKLALDGQGSLNDAARMMVGYTKTPAAQNSFHWYEANETIADLAYALGRFDTAEQYYAQLYGAPGLDIKVRARVRVGQCQLAQEKYEEAMKTFDQVITAELTGYEKGEEQKMLAKVGKAVCLASLGKPDEGIKMIEDIIQKGDPRNMVLFGRAYNALGACHLKAGRKKDALLAYLHTDILFYGDPDAHAEALYQLSKLWLDAKKSDRAVRARNELKSRYPGSLWARKE